MTRPFHGIRGSIRRIWASISDGKAFPFFMVTLPVLTLALVAGVPVVRAIILTFQREVLTRPQDHDAFIGLENYQRMVTDPEFWGAMLRSFVYMAGTVGGALLVGMVGALLTARLTHGRALARLAIILPWSIPAVAAALLWGVMYDANFGIINDLWTSLPGVDRNVEWLLNGRTVLPSLIVIQVWNEFPFAYIFILAGLQSIPDQLYEAAGVDGAGPLARFRYITLPGLRYVFAVTMILLTIASFRAFAIIFILTGGGPADRSETLSVQVYNEAFRTYNFSYASTLGVAALAFSFVVAVVYMRALSRGSEPEAMQ